jgi:hypothetical protein
MTTSRRAKMVDAVIEVVHRHGTCAMGFSRYAQGQACTSALSRDTQAEVKLCNAIPAQKGPSMDLILKGSATTMERSAESSEPAGPENSAEPDKPAEFLQGRFRKFGDQERRKGADPRGGGERRSVAGGDPTPSVFDWLESEHRQERRSGVDRRSGVARRGSVANRGDERRSIPFSIAPRGEVRTEDGCYWHCSLWDLSYGGLCVVANGCFELPLGTELNIKLFEVVGMGSAAAKASLRWFASDEFQTYLGLQFSEPGTLPPDTFLEQYLQTPFDV